MTVKVSVKPGPVVINHIWIISETEDAVVLYVDLKTKYAEVVYQQGNKLGLMASHRTINMDIEPANPSTEIVFGDLPDGHWIIVGEVSRYSGYFTALRLSDGLEEGSGECVYDREELEAATVVTVAER